jgi:hypothetical protein
MKRYRWQEIEAMKRSTLHRFCCPALDVLKLLTHVGGYMTIMNL